jgi:hypothetical protein
VETEFSSATFAAVIAYGFATLSAVLLYRRSRNWRMRFISIVVGILPVVQAAKLFIEAGGWPTLGSGRMPAMAELAVAAMFLCCVLVLKRESLTQGQTEERLRLAEGAAGWSTQGAGVKRLGRLNQCGATRLSHRCPFCDRPVRGFRRWFSRSPFCSDAHREAFLSQHLLPRLQDADRAAGSAASPVGY